ncbi:hypothetical protein [Rhodoligotrophos ferricapiens]
MSEIHGEDQPISSAQRAFWLGLGSGLIALIVLAVIFFMTPVLTHTT